MTSTGRQALGVDVGGSGVKGAIVDLDTGELVGERFRIETPQPATPDAVAQAVVLAFALMLTSAMPDLPRTQFCNSLIVKAVLEQPAVQVV